MADPTEAEIRGQIGYAVLALEELRQLAEADPTNLIGIEGELVASLESDWAAGILTGWAAFRSRVSDAISRGMVRTMLDSLILTYGKLIHSAERDAQSIFIDLYDYFIANSLTVEERGFTFGTATAGGSNIGTGTVLRLNVDRYGYDIDTQTADTKTLECVRDEHSGASEHREEFDIRGQERTNDYLTLKGGSGLPNSRPVGTLRAVGPEESRQFLQNPSFTRTGLADSAYSSSLATPTSVTEISGWTLDSVTDVQLDRAEYYRDSEGETSPQCVRFNANRYIQQNLNVRNAAVSFSRVGGLGQEMVPLYVQVAVLRKSDADGTVTLTFGSKTATVNVATLTNEVWSVLRIAVGTNNWFENWNMEDPLLKIALTSNTVGSVCIDDVIVAPFTWFDGGWWVVIGAETPFLRGDKFTFIDSVAETGLLQKWFVRGGYGYLPSAAAGASSWGDPPPSPTPSPTPTETVTPTPSPTPTPRTPTPSPSPTPTPTP